MEWIIIPFNVLVIFGTIYKVFELYARKDERKMIINKIEDIKGVDLSHTNLNMGNSRNSRFLSLRIGLLVLGLGIGCFAGMLSLLMILPRLAPMLSTHYVREMLMTSCICFFGGLALVISYIIEHKARCKENNDKENCND